MSGGSFNYLCYNEDLTELLSNTSGLESMRVALSSLGFADDAADKTQELIDLIERTDLEVQKRIEELKSVWKSVEWYHSGDYARDEVVGAVFKFRNEEAKTKLQNGSEK